jgi:LemA protein
MKRTTLIIIAAIFGLFLIGLISTISWGVSTNNQLVTLQEETNKQWAQVENVYKRRADLIPNLVATVKGYAKHESGTLEAVIAARAKATQITVDPNNLTPEKLKEYQAAQGQLSSALGKLMMIQENYPDLKANQNFLDLQAQLEGTENRITVERQKFNDVVQTYNTKVRTFPSSIIASWFGFEKKAYFEATEAEKATPKVEF